MKTSIRIVTAGFTALVFLTQAGIADAAEIKVFCGNAMKEVMEDLGPKFERATGHKLAITFAGLGIVVKRVQAGNTVEYHPNLDDPETGIVRLPLGECFALTEKGVEPLTNFPRPPFIVPA